MTRSEILETMARAMLRLTRRDALEAAEFALAALEAKGLAVVQGWQPIETADLELYSRATCLVVDQGIVGEARYFPEEGAWWWAEVDPTDTHGGPCVPDCWMPLPAPPKATRPSTERGVSESNNPQQTEG